MKPFLIIDIEADSLNPTKIWCAVTKEYETGEVRVWERPDLDGNDFSSYTDSYTLVGHNIIGYDFPALRDLVRPFGMRHGIRSCVDTLVLSRLANSWDYRSHSLEAWGKRLGFPKGDFSDFSKLTPEMVEYCKQDVELTYRIFKKLEPWWKLETQHKAIRLEHDIAILCEELHENGFKFDKARAECLLQQVNSELKELTDELQLAFGPFVVPEGEVLPRATKTGDLSKVNFKWLGKGKPEDYGFSDGAPFCRFSFEKFNPGSAKRRIEVLNSCGWKPFEKTKGHQKAIREGSYRDKKEYWDTYGWVCGDRNLETLPKDAPEGARKLVQWVTLDSRRSTLEEWLNALSEDDSLRIHGNFNHILPWTHRMSHSSPNMGNIPAVFYVQDKEPTPSEQISLRYNGEMRSLWGTDGLLVGTDAEGIQLRILAHYLKNEEYARSIVDGKKEDETDVHNVNKRMLGLNHITRDNAKTFIYAWILGAASPKIANILDCKIPVAKASTDRFMKSIKGLQELKQIEIPRDAKRGFFVGLDGRLVRCTSEHKMLAGYLQNGEAVVMKKANLIWRDKLLREKVPFKQVNFIHDEWQTEVPNDMEIAKYVGQTQADSIRQAGEELDLFCRLDGNYVVGKNWKETH